MSAGRVGQPVVRKFAVTSNGQQTLTQARARRFPPNSPASATPPPRLQTCHAARKAQVETGSASGALAGGREAVEGFNNTLGRCPGDAGAAVQQVQAQTLRPVFDAHGSAGAVAHGCVDLAFHGHDHAAAQGLVAGLQAASSALMTAGSCGSWSPSPRIKASVWVTIVSLPAGRTRSRGLARDRFYCPVAARA